jgi:hypothetical protein
LCVIAAKDFEVCRLEYFEKIFTCSIISGKAFTIIRSGFVISSLNKQERGKLDFLNMLTRFELQTSNFKL